MAIVTGSYGNSNFCIFLINLHNVFHSDCPSLYSYEQSTRVKGSFFSASLTTFFLCVLFSNSHSDTCEMISLMVLICLSLMINDIQCFFMCLLASFLEKKMCIQIFCPFFVDF